MSPLSASGLYLRCRFRFAAALAGLMLLGGSRANAASVFLAESYVEAREKGVVVRKDQQASGFSAVPVSRSAALAGSTGGQGSADAREGVVKVRASSSADAATPGAIGPAATATASARVDDTMVIRSPVLSGTGIAHVLAHLDRPVPPGLSGGVVNHSGLGDASIASTVRVGKAGEPGWLVMFDYAAQSAWFSATAWEEFSVNGTAVEPRTGLRELAIPFTVGQTLKIQMQASASAASQGKLNASGSADANLAHSLYWGGISSITVGGITTTNFTASGSGGIDWKKSYVPPPTVLPRLEIRIIGGVVQVSWLATDGVILEATDELSVPAAWESLPFTVSDGTASGTVEPTNNATFFRLRAM